MHICFIEDTHLRGGTKIWMVDAVRHFLGLGLQVTLITPAGSWVAARCLNSDVRLATVHTDEPNQLAQANIQLWSDQTSYRQIAKVGRQLIEQQFNQETLFGQLLTYFQERI